jgi:signal transduction histidine kinase
MEPAGQKEETGRPGRLRIVVGMKGWRRDLVAAACAVVAATLIALADPPDRHLPVLAILAMGLALRWPKVALVIEAVVMVAGGGTTPFATLVSITLMLAALGIVAFRSGGRVTLIAWALSYTALLVVLAINVGFADPLTVVPIAGFAGLSAVPLVVARYLRGLTSAAALAHERATEAEQRRAAEVRAARMTERTRLARDLHDLVAHHVGAMTLRASSARLAVDSGADGSVAAAALGDVAATGRRVLDELRVLLQILREPETANGEAMLTDPDAAMAEAIERIRAGGVPIDVDIDGGLADAPPLVRATVARVVQEALTNVLKHAGPGTSTQVEVRVLPSVVRARVTNERPAWVPALTARATPALPVSGHGLAGMRERVELLGGVLEAGPTPEYGWSVTVELPGREAS